MLAPDVKSGGSSHTQSWLRFAPSFYMRGSLGYPKKRIPYTIKSGKFLCFLLVWLVLAGSARAQHYVAQDGHLLDANTRLGSLGLNSNVRLEAIASRANLYITGNISSGASFQGVVPYTSPLEFNASLGSSTLSNFRRDTVGANQLSTRIARPSPYLDSSRGLTRVQGQNVVDTSGILKSPVTPVGASLRSPSGSQPGEALYLRPFSRSYSSLNAESSSDFKINPYQPNPLDYSTGYTEEKISPLESVFLPRTVIQPQDQELQPKSRAVQKEFFQPPDQRQLPQAESEESQPSEQDTEPYLLGQPEEPDKKSLFPPQEQDFQTQPSQRDLNKGRDAIDTTPVGLSLPDEFSAPSRKPSALGPRSRYGKRFGPSEQPDSTELRPGAPDVLAEIYEPPPVIEGFAQQRFDHFMSQGKKHMRQGQYYQAANAYGAAGIYDSQNTAALLGKGHALFAAGEYMSSAFFVNKALTLNPQLLQERINLRRFIVDREVFSQRMEDLERWQLESGQPMLYFLKGYILYQIGSFESAQAVLDKLQGENPDIATLQYLIDAVEVAGKSPAETESNSSVPQ